MLHENKFGAGNVYEVGAVKAPDAIIAPEGKKHPANMES
jgi:hypothetical protein